MRNAPERAAHAKPPTMLPLERLSKNGETRFPGVRAIASDRPVLLTARVSSVFDPFAREVPTPVLRIGRFCGIADVARNSVADAHLAIGERVALRSLNVLFAAPTRITATVAVEFHRSRPFIAAQSASIGAKTHSKPNPALEDPFVGQVGRQILPKALKPKDRGSVGRASGELTAPQGEPERERAPQLPAAGLFSPKSRPLSLT
jgi:hypothetical protein